MSSPSASGSNLFPMNGGGGGEMRSQSDYIMKLQQENEALRKELDIKESKLQTQMNSIKTFWSPELKQERGLRKEESALVSTLRDQLKLSQEEQQHSQLTIQALHDELRTQRDLNQMLQDDYVNRGSDVFTTTEGSRYLQEENERLIREYDILRQTVEELESRIEAQREILMTRDESVRKLLEMLQCKGSHSNSHSGSNNKEGSNGSIQLTSLKIEISDLESRMSHMRFLLDEKDSEIIKLKEQSRCSGGGGDVDYYKKTATMELTIRELENELGLLKQTGDKSREEDTKHLEEMNKHSIYLKNQMEQLKTTLKLKESELLTLHTKWDTMNNQQTDNRHHIEVLKESLHAKDQTIAILQSEIDALRYRVEEKEALLAQKQDQLVKLQEEKSNNGSELQHLKDTLDVKDRKMTVLHKKIERLADVLREKELHLREMNGKLSKITNETSNSDSVLSIMEDALTEKEKILDGLRKELDESKKIIEELEDTKLQLEDKLHDYQMQLDNHYNEGNDLRQEVSTNIRLLSKKDAKIAQLEGNLQQVTNERIKLSKEFQEYQDLNDKEKLTQEFNDKIEKLEEQLREKEAQFTQGQREIDRILDILRETEDEKHQKDAAIRNLEKVNKEKIDELRNLNKQMLEDIKIKTQDEELNRFVGKMKSKDLRIEELEEALKESVRITSEREMSLSNEKNTRRKYEHKVDELSSEMKRTKMSLEETGKKLDEHKKVLSEKQDDIKKLKTESKKLSEELFAKKQEGLVLAISEKDSQIALLERFRGNVNEIVKLKKEKEKLIHQLKLQSMQFNEENNSPSTQQQQQQRVKQQKEDEGIWA